MNGSSLEKRVFQIPNFLGLGAQRCATTWLHECLREHPDVFIPSDKEIHFFDKKYDKGWGWYLSHFEERKNEKAVGEITPEYLFVEDAAPRIAERLEKVKFIVCLRNPIERAYSEYGYHLRAGVHDLSFEQALERYPDYIERGFYCKQIKRFLRFFSRKQMLVNFFFDLEKDPVGFIRRVYGFLGVDDSFLPSQVEMRRNRGVREKSKGFRSVVDWGHKKTLQSPSLRSLINFLKTRPLVDRLLEEVFSFTRKR